MEDKKQKNFKMPLANRKMAKDVEKKILAAALEEADLWAQHMTEDIQLADVDAKIEELERELFKDKAGRKKIKSRKQTSPSPGSPEQTPPPVPFTADDDWNEPVAFTFDLGRLDAEMGRLVELLDTMHKEKPAAESTNARSLYTATSQTLEKLGLKVILNRIGVLLKYKNDLSDIDTNINKNSRDISTLIENRLRGISMLDGVNLLLRRSDHIFAKELGHISGCMVVYPEHLILMMEGPEIVLVDFFTQLYKTSLMKRITSGRVMFIMPHVLVRYLKDWVAVIATPEIIGQDDEAISTEEEKTSLALLGVKCRRLWRHVRKATKASKPVESLLDRILPEERLLEIATNTSLLRPFDAWIRELVNITYESSPFEDLWPAKEPTLPLNVIQKEDPYMFSPREDQKEPHGKLSKDASESKDLPTDVSKFLAGEKLPPKTIGVDGKEVNPNEIPERDTPHRKAPGVDKLRREILRKKPTEVRGKTMKDLAKAGAPTGRKPGPIKEPQPRKEAQKKESPKKESPKKESPKKEPPKRETGEEPKKGAVPAGKDLPVVKGSPVKVASVPKPQETPKSPDKVEKEDAERLKALKVPIKTVIMWGTKVREMPKVELKKADSLPDEKALKNEQEQIAARKEREMRIKKRFEKSLMISKLISGKRDAQKKGE